MFGVSVGDEVPPPFFRTMAHPAFYRIVVDVGQSRPYGLVILLDRQSVRAEQISGQSVSGIINLCKPRAKIRMKSMTFAEVASSIRM